ncbi:hypothetical protein PIROE2DRAFT_8551 [Piromyces sp. E2]|nr:hypothetical protein PIROE2DRAFT_8551 [Piromyces sp. E2]|eukprot:OUM64630.1 hypothetical protein PIROE2DRAFT_8551 [Piromyces sp. E2]
MNCHWTFIAFLMVCLSGVLSHAVDTTQLSKRSYNMKVPNAGSFKYRAKRQVVNFDKIEFSDRKLVGSSCVIYNEKGQCRFYGTVTIPLKYDAKCSYGDSNIKKIRVYDSDGDEVSELINITKVGDKNISSHRYIDFFFKNGCKFNATYNYRDTSMNHFMAPEAK